MQGSCLYNHVNEARQGISEGRWWLSESDGPVSEKFVGDWEYLAQKMAHNCSFQSGFLQCAW